MKKTFFLRKAQHCLVALLLISSLSQCNNNNSGKEKENDSTAKVEKKDSANVATPEASPENLKAAPPESNLPLHIANISNIENGKKIQIVFLEKEQVFTLDTNNNKELIITLRESLKSNKALKIDLDAANAVVTRAEKLSAEELTSLEKAASPKITAAKPIMIDVSKIDTVKLNRDMTKSMAALAGCTTWDVPDYATAVNIFNYCAKDGCNMPAPYPVTPCIPFQYVIDGCYARAHKMRYIIENVFHYCSQKVFSFANSGGKTLAVKASKWGGCCVKWWYHVAPILRVKINGVLYYYVIDPGMFNAPVPLATWLQAQATTTCAANAAVTAYSIQPSTAYAPLNYAGSQFSTDPNYLATNNILTLYKFLKTCP